jgi:hypothetical protein
VRNCIASLERATRRTEWRQDFGDFDFLVAVASVRTPTAGIPWKWRSRAECNLSRAKIHSRNAHLTCGFSNRWETDGNTFRRKLLKADVAQLVEQSIRNRQVSGSSPLVGSSLSINIRAGTDFTLR